MRLVSFAFVEDSNQMADDWLLSTTVVNRQLACAVDLQPLHHDFSQRISPFASFSSFTFLRWNVQFSCCLFQRQKKKQMREFTQLKTSNRRVLLASMLPTSARLHVLDLPVKRHVICHLLPFHCRVPVSCLWPSRLFHLTSSSEVPSQGCRLWFFSKNQLQSGRPFPTRHYAEIEGYETLMIFSWPNNAAPPTSVSSVSRS